MSSSSTTALKLVIELFRRTSAALSVDLSISNIRNKPFGALSGASKLVAASHVRLSPFTEHTYYQPRAFKSAGGGMYVTFFERLSRHAALPNDTCIGPWSTATPLTKRREPQPFRCYILTNVLVLGDTCPLQTRHGRPPVSSTQGGFGSNFLYQRPRIPM
jgi:hypothetical protein